MKTYIYMVFDILPQQEKRYEEMCIKTEDQKRKKGIISPSPLNLFVNSNQKSIRII